MKKPHPLNHIKASGRWIVAVCKVPAPGRTEPQLSVVAEEVHLENNLTTIQRALETDTEPIFLWSALRTATSYEDAIKFRRDFAQRFDNLSRAAKTAKLTREE